ncbi:MAG: adenylate/guanylate cyclase domain-containing protein [Candidatus Limnocylindria bacterium]
MAELGAKERAKLPDKAFAYVDTNKRRLLPIHDEPHVRNALARFNRVVFEDEGARDLARSRLLKAARKHGIVPVGFIEGQLRPKLPTGQLTLLFADIENSSQLVADLGDAYRPLLSAARRLERTAIRRANGFEVDARADEFFAVFVHAPDALAAAIAIQRAFGSYAWPDRTAVRVRIGMHTGRPTLVDGGYQGISVNAGARLCSCGHGGQILLSRTTHSVLVDSVPVDFRHLGTHRLRGIPDEHAIYQVVAADLLDGFPALRIEA